jgi:hypothetical protein
MCLDWRVAVGLAVLALTAGIVVPGPGAMAIPLLGVVVCLASKRFIIRRMHGPWCTVRMVAADPPSNEMGSRRSLLALQARLLSVRAEEDYLRREIARLQHTTAAVGPNGWPPMSIVEHGGPAGYRVLVETRQSSRAVPQANPVGCPKPTPGDQNPVLVSQAS